MDFFFFLVKLGHKYSPWIQYNWTTGYLGLPKSSVYQNLPESNINYQNPIILSSLSLICVNLDIYNVKVYIYINR